METSGEKAWISRGQTLRREARLHEVRVGSCA
jgi:hypothetical protein